MRSILKWVKRIFCDHHYHTYNMETGFPVITWYENCVECGKKKK